MEKDYILYKLFICIRKCVIIVLILFRKYDSFSSRNTMGLICMHMKSQGDQYGKFITYIQCTDSASLLYL